MKASWFCLSITKILSHGFLFGVLIIYSTKGVNTRMLLEDLSNEKAGSNWEGGRSLPCTNPCRNENLFLLVFLFFNFLWYWIYFIYTTYRTNYGCWVLGVTLKFYQISDRSVWFQKMRRKKSKEKKNCGEELGGEGSVMIRDCFIRA